MEGIPLNSNIGEKPSSASLIISFIEATRRVERDYLDECEVAIRIGDLGSAERLVAELKSLHGLHDRLEVFRSELAREDPAQVPQLPNPPEDLAMIPIDVDAVDSSVVAGESEAVREVREMPPVDQEAVAQLEEATAQDPAQPLNPLGRLPEAVDVRGGKAKKPPIQGSRINGLRKQFFSQVNLSLTRTTPSASELSHFKSLVCLGLALIENGPNTNDAEVIRDELKLLNAHWDATTDGQEFFGFSRARHHKPEVWIELHVAYQALGIAEDCMVWLESTAEVSDARREELLIQCAAAETLLVRVIDDLVPRPRDDQQYALHKRIQAAADGLFITWWKAETNGGPSTDEIRHCATSLETTYKRTRDGITGKEGQERALAALRALLNDPVATGCNEESIATAAKACIEAGIPPSNKDLTALLMPYRDVLKELAEPSLKRVLDEVGKQLTLLVAKRRVPDDRDIVPDARHESRLADLQAVLAGKTMIFIGGNKGQAVRRNELETELKVKKLLWPDAEETTNVSQLCSLADKADVVCQLIRWSRHSYRQVINDAKAKGKTVAVLPRGLGINTIVNDLHRQLCPGTPKKAKKIPVAG